MAYSARRRQFRPLRRNELFARFFEVPVVFITAYPERFLYRRRPEAAS